MLLLLAGQPRELFVPGVLGIKEGFLAVEDRRVVALGIVEAVKFSATQR
jgi:hypothetical protein